MSYMTVGVKSFGRDIPTKTALKAAIKTNPAEVEVYSTSDFHRFDDIATNLVMGIKYSVTGPNPYTNRKWYATLEKLANGTIKVS